MKNASKEIKGWRGRASRYVPLLLWIGVILFASTSQASASETSRFIKPFLEFLFPNAADSVIAGYHDLIRKSAHLIEYAILAFLASWALLGSFNERFLRFWFIASLFIVAAVASIDEFNQSFSAARTGSVFDVLIDILGGIVALSIVSLFKRFRNN